MVIDLPSDDDQPPDDDQPSDGDQPSDDWGVMMPSFRQLTQVTPHAPSLVQRLGIMGALSNARHGMDHVHPQNALNVVHNRLHKHAIG